MHANVLNGGTFYPRASMKDSRAAWMALVARRCRIKEESRRKWLRSGIHSIHLESLWARRILSSVARFLHENVVAGPEISNSARTWIFKAANPFWYGLKLYPIFSVSSPCYSLTRLALPTHFASPPQCYSVQYLHAVKRPHNLCSANTFRRRRHHHRYVGRSSINSLFIICTS